MLAKATPTCVALNEKFRGPHPARDTAIPAQTSAAGGDLLASTCSNVHVCSAAIRVQRAPDASIRLHSTQVVIGIVFDHVRSHPI